MAPKLMTLSLLSPGTWPALAPWQGKTVLASASPRRVWLLKQLGIRFRQIVSGVCEENLPGKTPREKVRAAAAAKAESVAKTRPNDLVIGCDTLVQLGNRCLGKPSGKKEALTMLKALNGRKHKVYSGLTLCFPDGQSLTAVETTRVEFRRMKDAELRWYVNSGEPMDKAGAYGIQGLGSFLVRGLAGCYYNVMGFPIALFGELIQQGKRK